MSPAVPHTIPMLADRLGTLMLSETRQGHVFIKDS